MPTANHTGLDFQRASSALIALKEVDQGYGMIDDLPSSVFTSHLACCSIIVCSNPWLLSYWTIAVRSLDRQALTLNDKEGIKIAITDMYEVINFIAHQLALAFVRSKDWNARKNAAWETVSKF